MWALQKVVLAMLMRWLEAVLGPAVWLQRHCSMMLLIQGKARYCCARLSEGLSVPQLLLVVLTLPACSLGADGTKWPCRLQHALSRAAQPPNWWRPVNRSGATPAMHLTCLLAVPHVGQGMATGRARPVMCAVLCSGMVRGRSRPACIFPVLACALAGASVQADIDLSDTI